MSTNPKGDLAAASDGDPCGAATRHIGLYAQKCWNSSSQYSVHEAGRPTNCVGMVYAPRGRMWMTVISYAFSVRKSALADTGAAQ